MQLPTHLIAGIITQTLIEELVPTPSWLTIPLIILFSFVSHFFLDSIAKATYHPPERIHDNFWLYWHIFAFGTGFIIIFFFIWEYWLGMIFAYLPDLWDWYTLRNIRSRLNKPEDWGQKYYLHPIANQIRTSLFNWLPDLTFNKFGVLPEFFLIFFWFLILALNGQYFL